MLRRLIKYIRFISIAYPGLRIGFGVLLVLVGFLALITPLTPGSWLALIGLEILGVRFMNWRRSKKIPSNSQLTTNDEPRVSELDSLGDKSKVVSGKSSVSPYGNNEENLLD